MSGGALSPEEFERTLVAIVPQRAREALSEVYFDAVTQLHERVVEGTPVDTSYLVAGLQATSGSDSPQSLGARDPAGNYAAEAEESAAATIAAIASAAKSLENLRMGFVADYAPFVEDKYHMVKLARAEWPAIVENSIRNQSAGSGEIGGGTSP